MTKKTDSDETGVSFKEFCEDIWYLAVAFRDEKDASKVTIHPIIAGRTVDSIQIPPNNIKKVRLVSRAWSSTVELVEIQMTGELSVNLETILMALPPAPPAEPAIYRGAQQDTSLSAKAARLPPIFERPGGGGGGDGEVKCGPCKFFQRTCCRLVREPYPHVRCWSEFCSSLYESETEMLM